MQGGKSEEEDRIEHDEENQSEMTQLDPGELQRATHSNGKKRGKRKIQTLEKCMNNEQLEITTQPPKRRKVNSATEVSAEVTNIHNDKSDKDSIEPENKKRKQRKAKQIARERVKKVTSKRKAKIKDESKAKEQEATEDEKQEEERKQPITKKRGRPKSAQSIQRGEKAEESGKENKTSRPHKRLRKGENEEVEKVKKKKKKASLHDDNQEGEPQIKVPTADDDRKQENGIISMNDLEVSATQCADNSETPEHGCYRYRVGSLTRIGGRAENQDAFIVPPQDTGKTIICLSASCCLTHSTGKATGTMTRSRRRSSTSLNGLCSEYDRRRENFGIFAVLDGHGERGQFAAQQAAKRLQLFITEQLLEKENEKREKENNLRKDDIETVKTCILEAINQTQTFLLEDGQLLGEEYGTTAVLAILKNDFLVVANVGDSRAVLFRDEPHEGNKSATPRSKKARSGSNLKIVLSSVDHRPNNKGTFFIYDLCT